MDTAADDYEACFAAFDLDRCQYMLEHPHEEEAYLSLPMIDAESAAPALLRRLKSQNGSINLRDGRVLNLLKKLMAYSIETFHSSLDNQARVTSFRTIVSLLSLPSSSAFGLRNSNIVHFLLATLVKFVSGQLKLPNNDARSSKKTRSSSKNIQLNIDVVTGRKSDTGRSSVRIASKNSHSSRPKPHTDKDDVASSDTDSEDIDCMHDDGAPMIDETNRGSCEGSSSSSERLRVDQLQLLVAELSCNMELLVSPTDEQDLNLCAEVLLDILFLCSLGREYAALCEVCADTFVRFAVTRTATLSCSYRALLSILTLSTRINSLPDAFKIRKSCHAIAMSALQRIVTASCIGDVATRLARHVESQEDKATIIALMEGAGADDHPVDILSDQPPVNSYPHMCLIGTLQRITLACPDKVPVRQLLSASIIDLLSGMHDVIDRREDDQYSDCMSGCVSLYLTFLSRLTRSSKVSHRAFAIDIAGQIITAHWIWQLSVEKDGSIGSAPANALLGAILGRCGDSSPAVRVRAISVVLDQLSSVNTDKCSPAMAKAVCAMLMMPSETSGDMTHLSLLDMLRDRASDEKIQVSTKAMQALSFVLSSSWIPTVDPDVVDSDADNPGDGCQLLISDEDLQLFSSKCADNSISVRKQAVSSLTELLLARPCDALIQDVWLQSILPMAYDPESSIVSKAAELMHRVLFNGMVKWSQKTKRDRLDEVGLVWRLVVKLATMGLLKLFKAIVGAMLKHGYLCVSASKSNDRSSSVLEIMSIIKYACCFDLEMTHESMDHSPSNRERSSASMRGYCDADEVVRGAWVLMEALVSLEHVSVGVSGDNQQPARFGDVLRSAGSADFVVQCFKAKHCGGRADDDGTTASLRFDDDDVRMFRVLQTLSRNLEAADAMFMMSYGLRYLADMQFDCHVAGTVVSLLMQLSKASVNEITGSNQPKTALKDIVKQWTSKLIGSAATVLRCYVCRDELPTATHDVSSALLTRLHRYLNSSIDNDDIDGDAAILPCIQAALFIVGEVAMLGFSMEEDQQSRGGNIDHGATTTTTTISEHFKLDIADEVINFVKILMGNNLPAITGASTSHSKSSKASTPRQCASKLRAGAFVAMGKLCMRDKSLARSQVNIFLREIAQTGAGEKGRYNHLVNLSSLCADSSMVGDGSMSTSMVAERQSSVVRSNALLVLGDMCIRYTSLVDRHVDAMAVCLQDCDSTVRKNALITLTQLLLQDYLKWRGFLLYRFLLLCIDADTDIAQFARNLLQKTLSYKFPQLLSNHFSEAVVILNGCTQHQVYHSVIQTNLNIVDGIDHPAIADDRSNNGPGFPIIQLSATQRFQIYSFMAESLDDESRIQVCAKLVQDILSHAVDHPTMLRAAKVPSKGSSLSGLSASEAAIEDVFQLLKAPFLKINQKRSVAADDDMGTDDLLDDSSGLIDGNTKISAKATIAQAKSKVAACMQSAIRILVTSDH